MLSRRFESGEHASHEQTRPPMAGFHAWSAQVQEASGFINAAVLEISQTDNCLISLR